MTELGPIFARLGLARYLDTFLDEGFETWETVLDITESDLDALQVKRGHRRILQREIARSRGYPSHHALSLSGRGSPSDEGRATETDERAGGDGDNRSAAGPAGKRKYRRHPKPDENAPERPPSAYVIFSNKMREELKGQSLSFTDIAKLVGEKWQLLDPEEKAIYESQAAALKEKYLAELAEYKKTDSYKEYTQYLADFKAKHSAPRDEGKRPKLEAEQSTASTSSLTSGSTGAAQGTRLPLSASHGRLDSIGSVPESTSSGYPSPSPVAQPAWHSLNMGSGIPQPSPPSISPKAVSPVVRPGHRDTRFGQGPTSSSPQVWPSVEESRPLHSDISSGSSYSQLPRIVSIDTGDPRASNPSRTAYVGEQVPYREGPNARRTEHPPPPFKHDDTSRSSVTATNAGAVSSRSTTTPAADDLRSLRTLPLPTQLTGSTSQFFDQLPRPLHPTASGSLQPSIFGPHTSTRSDDPPSSSSTPAGFDHLKLDAPAQSWHRLSEPPSAQAPSSPRLKMPTMLPRTRDLRELQVKSEDDMEDDPRSTSPFSILLRAGKSIEKADREEPP